MESMYGNENYIVVLVHEFDYLMHPSFIILHAHQASEYSDTVVDMDNVIPYHEGRKIIQGKLLAFFYGPSNVYPMETVEYFMVAITADLVFMVYESVMDVASR